MEDSKSQQPKKAPEDQEKPAVSESEKDLKDQEKPVAAESGKAAKEAKPAAPESETESGGETVRKSITLAIRQTSPDYTGEGSQLSPLTSDTTSGIDMGSGSATPSYALSGTETGSDPNILSSAADTSGDVTPPAKTKGKLWSFFTSPNKKESDFSVPKEKPRSRFSFSKMRGSRSLSPEKSLKVAAESESIPPAEGACAKSNDKDSAEKTDKGLYTRLKRTWSVIMGKKSTSTESDSLVSNVEAGKTDTKLKDKTDTEKIVEADDENTTIIYWTEGRSSLVSDQSVSFTTTTDLPSTYSGSEVFVTEGVKSSEGSENTSQEAVAGSLASSSSENISRAEPGTERSSEKVKNDDTKTADECSNKKDETKSENQKSKEVSECKDDKNSQPDT